MLLLPFPLWETKVKLCPWAWLIYFQSPRPPQPHPKPNYKKCILKVEEQRRQNKWWYIMKGLIIHSELFFLPSLIPSWPTLNCANWTQTCRDWGRIWIPVVILSMVRKHDQATIRISFLGVLSEKSQDLLWRKHPLNSDQLLIFFFSHQMAFVGTLHICQLAKSRWWNSDTF